MEIEIKLRLSSRLPAVRRILRDTGFRISERRMLETNIIFDDANSTLAGQGKLIRLRRVGGQGILSLTKGLPSPAATRSVRKSKQIFQTPTSCKRSSN
jgi:adenylate cyclase class IV